MRPSPKSIQIFSSDHNIERQQHIRRYAFAEQTDLLQEAASRVETAPVEAALAEVQEWMDSADGQTCLKSCSSSLLRNGVCDPSCNTATCRYDGGDCGRPPVPPPTPITQSGAAAAQGGATQDGGAAGSAASAAATAAAWAAANAVASASTVTPGQASDRTPPPGDAAPAPPSGWLPPSEIAIASASPLAPSVPLSSSPFTVAPLVVSPSLPPPAPSTQPPSPLWPRVVCLPNSGGEPSPSCSGAGICEAPGYCACFHGFVGHKCEGWVAESGDRLHVFPRSQVATLYIVWGLREAPSRALDGTPLAASVDRSAKVLAPAAQLQISELCRFLEIAPPAHVRKGSIVCPLQSLRRDAERRGMGWPLTEDAALLDLRDLAARDAEVSKLIGWNEADGSVDWIAVRLRTNTLAVTGADHIRPDADWFEAMLAQHEAGNAFGSDLRGWLTSDAYVWMEATQEAVRAPNLKLRLMIRRFASCSHLCECCPATVPPTRPSTPR